MASSARDKIPRDKRPQNAGTSPALASSFRRPGIRPDHQIWPENV